MNNRLILIGLSILGIAILAFLALKQPKTGYIFIQNVYNNFEYKKEVEKKFLATKNARQKKLDSLELEIKIMGTRLSQLNDKEMKNDDLDKFNDIREEYLKKKQIMEQDNDQLSHQYDIEILTQLNQYIKDYGVENNYTYIFGNDGNGSLMFAREKDDISKEVIEYVNNRYAGKNIK